MLKDFQECTKAHDQGIAIHPDDSDGFFLVRRIGTSKYNREIEEIKLTKYGYFAADSDVDYLALMGAWLAEFGVTGWGGIIDPVTGQEIPFSLQAARQIFTNPEYIGLVSELITQASNRGLYLKAVIDSYEKELKKP